MNIKDKKIAFLGDSITVGVGTSNEANVYWRQLERETGARCFGYGISGTRIAKQHVPSTPTTDRYFASRLDDMIPDADVVVVLGGVNDYDHGDAPFGTHADRDESTFCGALHLLMEKLIARYPDATIIFMTPLHFISEDDLSFTYYGVRRCCNLQMYADAIIEAGAYYGIPVLDLYRTSGIQPKVDVLREKYMPDGLHPNDAGHEKIASRLRGFISSL